MTDTKQGFDLAAVEKRYEAVIASNVEDTQLAAALAYSLDAPVLIAEVKRLTEQLVAEREGAGNAAYYYDEEVSRLNASVEDQRHDLDERDRRIRDLKNDLYEAQRQAERIRREASW